MNADKKMSKCQNHCQRLLNFDTASLSRKDSPSLSNKVMINNQVLIRVSIVLNVKGRLQLTRRRQLKVSYANVRNGMGFVFSNVATTVPSAAVRFDSQVSSFVSTEMACVGEGTSTLSTNVLSMTLFKVTRHLSSGAARKVTAGDGAGKDAHSVLGVNVMSHLFITFEGLQALRTTEGGHVGVY